VKHLKEHPLFNSLDD